ncbi:MAG TPA: NAD-dependent deacylase [Chitinophagales bacterium]|nr:NAD-dependent deacylase [Chitinophagales bacterium]
MLGRKKIVVLTGAGMSAESGISTFRDSNGLWENHNIYDVASPEGFQRDPLLVNGFYNERRKQLLQCQPNLGHIALAELEKNYDVYIITQNVDDLHERAGSTSVIHLHGELRKVRSVHNPDLIMDWDSDISPTDSASDGHPLRPHIVWFGENVPLLEDAITITQRADIFIVIGTSLQVYPAASLIDYVGFDVPKYLIDPHAETMESNFSFNIIPYNATIGVPMLIKELTNGTES